MDFLTRQFSFSTYLFHAYLFLNQYWKTLFTYSFVLNIPFIGIGVWLLLENILEQVIRNTQIEIFLGYLFAFSFLLFLFLFFIVLPFAQLNLTQKISSLVSAKIKENFNSFFMWEDNKYSYKDLSLKCLKYNFILFIFFSCLFFSFFFFLFGAFFLFGIVFLILQIFANLFSTVIISVGGVFLFVMMGCTIYALCFGALGFLPFVVLHKNKSTLQNLLSYTFTNMKPIFGLFFLEALVKISFIIPIILLVSLYNTDIHLNIGSDFTFNNIQNVANSDTFKQKILYGIAFLSIGIIGFVWDIFKCFYLSFLYFKNEIHIPEESNHAV